MSKLPRTTGHPWLVFVLPLAVYMLVGSLEPKPPRAEGPAAWAGHRVPLLSGSLHDEDRLTVVAILLVAQATGGSGSV